MSKDPSTFSIGTDFGWQQWGADRAEHLGNSSPVLEAIKDGLINGDVEVVSDNESAEGK